VPNIKSAKKRVLVSKRKHEINQTEKSALKTELKKAEAAIASGEVELAEKQVASAVKKIDQSVAKGLLHKNTAAHRKSSLTRKVNALKG